MDRKTLIRELSGKTAKDVDVDRLIQLVFEYFGDEDGDLVLQIALFFKRPGCYQWLGSKVIERLEEGMTV